MERDSCGGLMEKSITEIFLKIKGMDPASFAGKTVGNMRANGAEGNNTAAAITETGKARKEEGNGQKEREYNGSRDCLYKTDISLIQLIST